MERLVVIWCPELLEEGARGEEARRFARVLARAGELCPWVHPVRLGVVRAARPRARPFFGGEEAVVALLAERGGRGGRVGVADGLFAAVLAARSELIVPPGGTADFLAPWSVATLARPDLAVTLQRLGVTTLGQLAALPAASVSDRFGADAAACHAVARGESGELAGLRDRAIERRLRVARGEDPDRRRRRAAPARRSPASSAARRRPTAAPRAPSSRCRSAWVSRPCWWAGSKVGATRPASRCCVPWGSPEAGDGASGGRALAGAAAAARAQRRAAGSAPRRAGRRRGERHGGERARDCSPRRSTGSRSTAVPGSRWWAWAGPWPVTERWWSVRRRTARLQVVTADGVARLLRTERGQWWVEALYD